MTSFSSHKPLEFHSHIPNRLEYVRIRKNNYHHKFIHRLRILRSAGNNDIDDEANHIDIDCSLLSPRHTNSLNNTNRMMSTMDNSNKKFLALITESDACDTDERMEETFDTIRKVILNKNGTDDHCVDLISIRVNSPSISDKNDRSIEEENKNSLKEKDHYLRLVTLAKRIMRLKEEQMGVSTTNSNSSYDFCVVINDNVQAAIESNVDGVHVKESKAHTIPQIREMFKNYGKRKRVSIRSDGTRSKDIVLGTSAHSVDCALQTWQKYKPDYFFVGTCYLTQSHPEKASDDLEGPSLPGMIKLCIDENKSMTNKDGDVTNDLDSPIIFAIGGIELSNCREPVKLGADGVAVIRSIMQAEDPAKSANDLKKAMVQV